MIWLTGAIAFFGLTQAAVGVFQWNVMKGQLAEMKSSGDDTHALAIAAGQQATATQDQARKMDAALSQNRKALVISERAYLHVASPSITQQGISLPIENSGHVAAPSVSVKVERIVANVLTEKLMAFSPKSKTFNFGGDRTPVPPGRSYYGITIPLNDLDAEDRNALDDNTKVLYISGKIIYAIGFGSRDEFSFCFVYNRLHPLFDSCAVVKFSDLRRFDDEMKKRDKAKR
jgi:hypothetical protein